MAAVANGLAYCVVVAGDGIRGEMVANCSGVLASGADDNGGRGGAGPRVDRSND